MNPITFPESNAVLAKNQPEYLPLPVCRTADGQIISCWSLSWRERLSVLVAGRVWLRVLAYNQLLQPQRLQVESPFAPVKLTP